MGSTKGSQFEIGTVEGTGADISVFVPAFTPRKVILRNAASGDELVWVGTMPYGGGLKRLAAGASSLIATGGVTPVYQLTMAPYLGDPPQDPKRGFVIGDDSDINAVGEEIHWEAWE